MILCVCVGTARTYRLKGVKDRKVVKKSLKQHASLIRSLGPSKQPWILNKAIVPKDKTLLKSIKGDWVKQHKQLNKII